MVFSKDYDNSLWLMVAGDDSNRDKITLVVKNIPYELMDQIHELINEYEKDNINKTISYQMDSLSYEVSIVNSELFVKMIREIDEEKEEIELYILPINEELLGQMKRKTPVYLGGFTNSISYDCMKYGTRLGEYEIVKTLGGKFVKFYSDNRVKCLSRKKVNVKMMPESFGVYQLRTDKSIKRLVRGKK